MRSHSTREIQPGHTVRNIVGKQPANKNTGREQGAYPGVSLPVSFDSIHIHTPGTLCIQPKLTINQPGDPYEQEADAIADKVMRMSDNALSLGEGRGEVIQRKCAHCEEEEEKKLQRKESGIQTPAVTTSLDNYVGGLNNGGQLLPASLRDFYEPRLGYDFSKVKIHNDARAAQSAQSIHALAYTHGNNIVFNSGQYSPQTNAGKRLLGHELTHVVQQTQNSTAGKIKNQPASSSFISRQNDTEVAGVMNRATVPASGIVFVPRNLVRTVVGFVSGALGGLRGDRTNRLNVIIGANITLRQLARMLVPLWLNADPFTSEDGTMHVPTEIDELTLAKALFVYNQTYLAGARMESWRAGLRFPLPIEIDETTGVGTLHPDIIQSLSTGFQDTDLPALDMPAPASVALTGDLLSNAVNEFLAAQPTALDRGIHLFARAMRNTLNERHFIIAVFDRLPAEEAFDVALEFFNNAVNREISIIASQSDGVMILDRVRSALANTPASISQQQRENMERANRMLTSVSGIAAVPAPGAASACPGPQKTINVDIVSLVGSNRIPSQDIAYANMIFSQCCVNFNIAKDEMATDTQTNNWIGTDQVLTDSVSCGTVSSEERAMVQGATTDFSLSNSFRVFYVTRIRSGPRAYSVPPFCGTGTGRLLRNMSVVSNSAQSRSLAHEFGHILLNSSFHAPGSTGQVMHPTNTSTGELFTATQRTTIYNNA